MQPFFYFLLSVASGARLGFRPASEVAAKPPPDPALECALQAVLFNASTARLPWFSDPARIYDALQLGRCPSGPPRPERAVRTPLVAAAPVAGHHAIYVSSSVGRDGAGRGAIDAPLRTLTAARDAARLLRAASSAPTVVYVTGTFFAAVADSQPLLLLDSSLDSGVTWRSHGDTPAVISGGIPLTGLVWGPSSLYPAPVLSAMLPPGVPVRGLFSLFDGDASRRLPLAREPNSDAETQMQPSGWALVRGNAAGDLPFPGASTHMEVDTPQRNNSNFPVWGRDNDPRNPGVGYVWYGEGAGAAGQMAGNRTYWLNKTIPGGLLWNATGGADRNGYMASPFNATGWPSSAPGRRVHVFHGALWGNWVYDAGSIDVESQSIVFSRGGWQEGRGEAGMGTQPFFVEGEALSLDSPTEWWVDPAAGVLHLWPNGTLPPSTLVVPVLETVLSVRAPASDVSFEGISFQHTIDGLMLPYLTPEAGDWSLRAAAAVEVNSATRVTFSRCGWTRVGGNGLIVTGNSRDVKVLDSDFLLPGSSGVVVVGTPFGPANATPSMTTDGWGAYPVGVTIARTLFEGIGVLGKQSSALFVSVACNVTIEDSVAYSGPRSAVNINDGFCGGHNILRNVIFDFVRETQDHGHVNTWHRQMYVDPANPSQAAAPVWMRVVSNAIWNGPSPNRDLGNLWPGVDNDDGSSQFWISSNLLIYGGAKNYLGDTKVWDSNLIVIPERWAGDPCITAWRGSGHVFTNNTCITPTSGSPNYFDSSLSGSTCIANYSSPESADFLPNFARNSYTTFNGQFAEGCAGELSLQDLNALGQEVGSVVASTYKIEDVVAHARALLA